MRVSLYPTISLFSLLLQFFLIFSISYFPPFYIIFISVTSITLLSYYSPLLSTLPLSGKIEAILFLLLRFFPRTICLDFYHLGGGHSRGVQGCWGVCGCKWKWGTGSKITNAWRKPVMAGDRIMGKVIIFCFFSRKQGMGRGGGGGYTEIPWYLLLRWCHRGVGGWVGGGEEWREIRKIWYIFS